jgi:hypothetical protein
MTNGYAEYKVSSVNIIILDLHTTCMEVIFDDSDPQDVALCTKFVAVLKIITAFKNRFQSKKNMLLNYFRM